MKKVNNFYAALENLNDVYDYDEPYDNVVLTGLVALYEICFEQAWQAMKEVLEHNGFEGSQTGSPKHVLKTAYQAKLITDEALWLRALVARNNVANAYNRDVALDIVQQTKQNFYKMFCVLKNEIEQNWNE